MQKLCFVSLYFLLMSYTFATEVSTSEMCNDLDKKIDDIQLMQGNFKVNEQDKVSDYVAQMEFFNKSLVFFENLHQNLMLTPGAFNIEAYLQSQFPDSKDPLHDQLILKYLSLIAPAPGCPNLDDEAGKESCSDALLFFQHKKNYESAKYKIVEAREKLNVDLQTVYYKPEFQKMSVIGQYLAADKLKNCPEHKEEIVKNENAQCVGVQTYSNLDNLAINSLDAISKYLVNENTYTVADLKKSCVSLLNAGYSPLACSGVACQTDYELVSGECLKKCNNLEIRAGTKPFACYPDEQAQIAKNQRIQKRKEGWGKVLRTSSVIVVAGGAVAGTAYLLHEIYKDKSLITYNDHPSFYNYSTSYNSNYTYNTTTNSTTSTPNTPFYNYNPYSSYYSGYSGYGGYPNYQYGYNPYYSQGYNSYYQGAATNPFGTGLGSGDWGGGFAF